MPPSPRSGGYGDMGTMGGGGDGGIRTLDTPLQAYNGLANRRLQPLGHVSSGGALIEARWTDCKPREARHPPRFHASALTPIAHRRIVCAASWETRPKTAGPIGWARMHSRISLVAAPIVALAPSYGRDRAGILCDLLQDPMRAIAASSAATRPWRHVTRADSSFASPRLRKRAAMRAAAPPAGKRRRAQAKRAP